MRTSQYAEESNVIDNSYSYREREGGRGDRDQASQSPSLLNIFEAISIKVASPDVIRSGATARSKPDTINYRSFKPRRRTLCERNSPPARLGVNCGKYKRSSPRHHCDRCGSNHAGQGPSRAHGPHRAGRPVSHIWFLSACQPHSLMLDMTGPTPREAHHYEDWVVTYPGEPAQLGQALGETNTAAKDDYGASFKATWGLCHRAALQQCATEAPRRAAVLSGHQEQGQPGRTLQEAPPHEGFIRAIAPRVDYNGSAPGDSADLRPLVRSKSAFRTSDLNDLYAGSSTATNR
jgi:DNA-directed RNA polymerase beta' subunit